MSSFCVLLPTRARNEKFVADGYKIIAATGFLLTVVTKLDRKMLTLVQKYATT
jgi:hypothetical protein